MALTARPVRTVSGGEVRNALASFKPELREGELLAGSPAAQQVNGTGLTISDVGRNTAPVVINDNGVLVTVEINEGVVFSVANLEPDRRYTVRVTCPTNSNPAQTLVTDVEFQTPAS